MFAYAAALLDFQKGGVGYITKGNGLHYFRKLNKEEPPCERFVLGRNRPS